jgi:hypothetical protein
MKYVDITTNLISCLQFNVFLKKCDPYRHHHQPINPQCWCTDLPYG